MSGVGETALTVKELMRFLSALASLNGDVRTGNRNLSQALQTLIVALEPHAGRPVSDLVATFQTEVSPSRRRRSRGKSKATLPPNLETISRENLEQLLCDEKLKKQQLIEVGFRRFGISKSRLSRIRRNEVLDVIRAALDHERSLNAITHEARRGGIKRSS